MDAHSNQFISNADDLGGFEEEESHFDHKESEDTYEEKYPGRKDNEPTTSEQFAYYPDSPAGAYFREMGKLPLLSPEEECDLAKKIEEGEKRIKTLLLQSPPGLEWITRVADQMERGEIRAKDILEASKKSIRQKKEDDLP